MSNERVYRPTVYGDNSVLVPLQRRSLYQSQDSIGRYSERTIHWTLILGMIRLLVCMNNTWHIELLSNEN